jgi:hypothetical protein
MVVKLMGMSVVDIASGNNPRTREMFARVSILCFWVTDESTCHNDGMRVVKRLSR